MNPVHSLIICSAGAYSSDIIGESYYPQWHGTLDELKYNLNDLSKRYNMDAVVAEYTAHKIEVNDIAFTLPGGNVRHFYLGNRLTHGEYFDKRKGDRFPTQYLPGNSEEIR